MSLRWKFLLSYLAVVCLVLVAIVAATALVAPEEFSVRIQGMGMPGGGPRAGMGRSQGTPAPVTTPNPSANAPDGPVVTVPRQSQEAIVEFLAEIEEDLNDNFRESINRALLIATLVAVVAASAASLWISQRIVKPIHALGEASQRIAAGNYRERLHVTDNDELGDLTRSFNAMAGALAETEAMRQQLIADVSHELNTPLSTIKGYMEGFQDGVLNPTPEAFSLVKKEADRLQRLVADLQELSRAEADQIPLHLDTYDANELAASAAEWLRPQFADRAITLDMSPLGAPRRVRADFDRARQVLLNLLGNALQYTPDGGQVHLTVTPDEGAIRFSITDTGPGLARADLERIFQRFYRVDKSRARASGGSGIGLTIARHIAEAHGGKLWAESAGPGQGSTFHFTLPLTTE